MPVVQAGGIACSFSDRLCSCTQDFAGTHLPLPKRHSWHRYRRTPIVATLITQTAPACRPRSFQGTWTSVAIVTLQHAATQLEVGLLASKRWTSSFASLQAN